MSKLILATFAAAALFAVTSSANAARGCDEDFCGTNGTLITGIALGGASTGTVNAVILPSGEIVDLR